MNNNNSVLRSMPSTLGMAPLQYSTPSIQLPILQKQKLRPREFRSLAQGHTIGKWQSRDLNLYFFWSKAQCVEHQTVPSLHLWNQEVGREQEGEWEAVTRRTCSDTSYVHVNQERAGMYPLSLR